MQPLAIYTDAQNLTKLLGVGRFPALPAEWQDLEGANAWYTKVASAFKNLGSCDLDGFGEICRCLEEELEVEYLAFIREHHVDRFSAFDTFLKMLSIEPYIINEYPCERCESLRITCSPHKAEQDTMTTCEPCVKQGESCSLQWIPTFLFNIQFRKKKNPAARRHHPPNAGASGTNTARPLAELKNQEADTALEEAILGIDTVVFGLLADLAEAVSEATALAMASIEPIPAQTTSR